VRDVVHIHDLNALEQAEAVRRGEISPVEITEHYLDRIARLDSQVGAYVTVTPEPALEQAQKAEAGVLAGGDLSPLLGVPIPIKDLNLVRGVPVHFGSAAYEDFVAPVDDSVVERLRDAGTIMFGKTATPEFGMPCYTETSISPPTRRSASCWPGGSTTRAL
jgi:amidase